jgi:hypothetical protein
MKSTPTLCAVAVVALLAWTLLAQAQGTSGSTGAVASIPSSVVRAGEQRQPVTQPGIISIITGSTLPGPNVDSKQKMTRRGATPLPSK